MESKDLIYKTSRKLYTLSESSIVDEKLRLELNKLAADLECSDHCLYEGAYEDLCDMITPYINPDQYGFSSCSEKSLTSSVVESFQYLLEFWLENKEK